MPSTRQMHLTGSTRHCDQYGDNRLSKGSRRKLLSSVRRISLLHADRLRFGLQSRRRWLSLRAAPFRRRREGGAHAQNSSHCFVDMLSGLARYGVCNAHRLERYGRKSRQRTNRARTWRMWPPQTSRAIWRLQVEPLVKHPNGDPSAAADGFLAPACQSLFEG